ncbi:arylsulfatase [Oscillatoria amoena NRMC-F 0135]|nr:arylsulfatase [Oscillatoria amoena NRMC-F 0135]
MANTLGASLGAKLALGQRKRPNILFILLDDAGPGDFGFMGQKYIQTPNADRLAREGMVFTQAYAGGAVCAPSRATMLTGLHQGHAPIRANAGTIPLLDSEKILPQYLQEEGYVCGGFGKWAMGDAFTSGAPHKKGFNKFFGYLHQTHAHNYYTDLLWDVDRSGEKRVRTGGQYSADLIAEENCRWLQENVKKQFFCYATWTLPHGRFEIPDLGLYKDKDWPEKYKIYAAMITRADSYIGRLLDILRQANVERDTLILFASDNGGTTTDEYGFSYFGTNLRLRDKKGSLYEGGIRTPMIARQPGRIRPGSVCHEPVAFCDYLPTLVEKAPAGIDGISFQPALDGKPLPKREYLYWEFNAYNIPQKKWNAERFAQAVRFGDWKAIIPRQGAALELYNLAKDPSETKDLSSQFPALVQRARKYMAEAHQEPRSHADGSSQWVL